MAPSVQTSPISERQLQDAVVEMAHAFGWLAFHTYDSRRSAPGFPDLILANGERTLAVELKSQRGRLSPEQSRWLQLLDGSTVTATVWRPDDWRLIGRSLESRIERTLRAPAVLSATTGSGR